MVNYADTIYMDSSTTYPAGKLYDRLVVVEDCTFSTFTANYKVGNTTTKVTATEIDSLTAGQVMPGPIENVVLTSGKVLLSRG